jgi:4-oxalocrotonate tautomerase
MEEPTMPLIEVKLMEEAFTLPPKNEIGSEPTDATSSVQLDDMCTLGWTDLEEVPSEDWELGGLSMTTEALRALIAGE